ncbi:hypothetical protein ACWGLC_17570 [Dietzia sp. NPDC055877]
MTGLEVAFLLGLLAAAFAVCVLVVSEERADRDASRLQALHAVDTAGDRLPFVPASEGSDRLQRRGSGAFCPNPGATPKTVRPGSLSDRLQRAGVHT